MIRLFLALAFIPITTHVLCAQSSANFMIEADGFDAGGLGNASPKSANFSAIAIIGQAAARGSSTSPGFDLSSGVACLFCGKGGPVGVDAIGAASAFVLGVAYPNPTAGASNGMIRIPYELAAETRLTLHVRDVYGRVLAVLHDGTQTAGRHIAAFDASPLARGSYFIELRSGDFMRSVVLTVLR